MKQARLRIKTLPQSWVINMDIFGKEYNAMMDYVHCCKFINKYKLVNRFNCSDEEAYTIIDHLLENEEIVPMVNFDFRVMIREFDLGE